MANTIANKIDYNYKFKRFIVFQINISNKTLVRYKYSTYVEEYNLRFFSGVFTLLSFKGFSFFVI